MGPEPAHTPGEEEHQPISAEAVPPETSDRPASNILFDRRTHEKTGIELIRIPAGPFLYGQERRVLELPEFWIGRYPVTFEQYSRFLDQTKYPKPSYWAPYEPNCPVVFVSWEDANRFCKWADLVLPTEKQWEKAARGTDGRTWPWGNMTPPRFGWRLPLQERRANLGEGHTTPVGLYSPAGDSPYGCADMVGNVWEWTSSLNEEGHKSIIIRGGSAYPNVTIKSVTERGLYKPRDRDHFIGFRVVELLSNPGF
jgi:serine/threonine-protein kinase